MNSIDAFENEIHLQKKLLKSFVPHKQLTANMQKNSIFTGSGDSLVSSMLAESFSNSMVRAFDPLDLLQNSSLFFKKRIFLVSISGKTITNIRLAKLSKKSIAITSNPQSTLAKVSKKVIHLEFENSGIFTGGTISFLASALSCISLVKKFNTLQFSKLFELAKNDSKKIKLSKRIFILGNFHTYPISIYFAAKFYELLGTPVNYSRIEQFSHMELFSISKGDTVIILDNQNSHNNALVKKLKKNGICVFQTNLPRSKLGQVIYSIFLSQFVVLNEAKRKNKKECHFITSKKIRQVSNDMIY